ncbi:hypothetical protein HNQ07_004007 [Deinococcus metalli]|uniref:Uncharacterized protein n=1 Tax=Deinococcus metalli TaxID=1141878 RepID=A0A7W8NS28_9DEIO|nr:hypothetical protein [Deinococcus metalli]GHF58164.1 hypothetical protein GCM10017781_38010 [Deinococcus metalli]
MGLLNQIVAASRGDHLDVLHSVEHRKFAKGCTVTPELVRVDGDRDAMLAQEPDEEGRGSFGIPVTLKEHVQDNTVFVDCPP